METAAVSAMPAIGVVDELGPTTYDRRDQGREKFEDALNAVEAAMSSTGAGGVVVKDVKPESAQPVVESVNHGGLEALLRSQSVVPVPQSPTGPSAETVVRNLLGELVGGSSEGAVVPGHVPVQDDISSALGLVETLTAAAQATPAVASQAEGASPQQLSEPVTRVAMAHAAETMVEEGTTAEGPEVVPGGARDANSNARITQESTTVEAAAAGVAAEVAEPAEKDSQVTDSAVAADGDERGESRVAGQVEPQSPKGSSPQVSPTTGAQRPGRVAVGSGADAQVDAAKAAWNKVEMQRAGRTVRASVLTNEGEISVLARSLRGGSGTLVEATVPRTLLQHLSVQAADELRRDLADGGIENPDVSFKAQDQHSASRDQREQEEEQHAKQ